MGRFSRERTPSLFLYLQGNHAGKESRPTCKGAIMNTAFTNTCKELKAPFTQEEKYLLGLVQPDAYTEALIKVFMIAMTEKVGHATQLAAIYPELAHAVNCLLNGNLQEVYAVHKARIAENLKALGC